MNLRNPLFWITAFFIILATFGFATSFSAFTESYVPQGLSALINNKVLVVFVGAAFATIFYRWLAWANSTLSIFDMASIFASSLLLATLVVTGRGLEYVIGIVLAENIFSDLIYQDMDSSYIGTALIQINGSNDNISHLLFSVISTLMIGLIIFKIRRPITSKDYVENVYD